MESALRPRDIQARIRAGASPDEVAEAAGVPVEKIAAFADPVIAERDYIAGLARTNPVRRRGETTSHRTLRNAVADALAAKGVDADEAEWDAWKLEDRRWQVRVGAVAPAHAHPTDPDGERGERRANLRARQAGAVGSAHPAVRRTAGPTRPAPNPTPSFSCRCRSSSRLPAAPTMGRFEAGGR